VASTARRAHATLRQLEWDVPMKLLRLIDLPPVWGAAFFVAIWLWAQALPLAPLPLWTVDLGRVLMLLGIGWAGWAAVYFLTHRTPIEPRHTPRVMLTQGPYRLTRHPIYRGLIWVVLGWALTEGEATAVPLALLYGWLLRHRFVLPEEAVLEREFPADFEAWRVKVPLQL
jgi:protein-S-isoprenylcysteine O-methyltransferase Ste14